MMLLYHKTQLTVTPQHPSYSSLPFSLPLTHNHFLNLNYNYQCQHKLKISFSTIKGAKESQREYMQSRCLEEIGLLGNPRKLFKDIRRWTVLLAASQNQHDCPHKVQLELFIISTFNLIIASYSLNQFQRTMNNPLLNHKQEIDQALFLAISREDFDQASSLLKAGSNPNAIFLLQKNVHASSFNLFLSKAAQIGKSKGPSNVQYIACSRLLRVMVKQAQKPVTLECKCLKEHKCPLYIALQAFKITTQDHILECKCDLLRYLIQNGASIKFQQDQDKKALKSPGKWCLRWFDLQGLRTYLITKNFNYVETKLEL